MQGRGNEGDDPPISLGDPDLHGTISQDFANAPLLVFLPVAHQAAEHLAAQGLPQGGEDRSPRPECQPDNGFLVFRLILTD